MKRFIGTALGLLLCVCAGCTAVSKGAAPAETDACEEAYTFAPASYVINVAMGEAVILDPVANEFPLYCTPQAARERVEQLRQSGSIPANSEWKIYRVYGNWNDITTEISPGYFVLNRAVPLIDWVD